MREQTIRVFWKGKFNGAAVTITAADFNPKLHKLEADGPWEVKAVPAEKAEKAGKSATK